MTNKFILLFIASSLLLFGACNKGNVKGVKTDTVQKRNITESVSANGKIQPEIDVKISPEVSGKVMMVHVKEGDEVKKGDLLITLNPDLLEASLSRSTASLNNMRANYASARARSVQAEAQFTNQKKMYDRTKDLFAQGVISQAEMDQAESNYLVAEAERSAANESVSAAMYSVRSAEATEKEAKDNLGRTMIYAPNDGVITALQVEEGETVLGTIQTIGTEVMRVSKLDLMEVDVEVNESDIVRVSMNDTAFIEVDAYLDRKFTGVVTEISNAANNSGMMSTDQVTNFSVKIRILPSSYSDLMKEGDAMSNPFRTGMSATVEINTDSKQSVLSIPIEAVTTRTDTTKIESFKERRERKKEAEADPENNEPIECVFLYNDGIAKIRPVKTGIQDNRYIEIISGLEEGEEVITGPYAVVSRELEEGSKVELDDDGDKDDDE
jgi:HlyD family secretion protein